MGPLAVTVMLAVLAVGTLWRALPAAAAGDLGHRDQSYAPLGGSASGSKPESKLWWNGGWWASMFNVSADEYRIYRLNPATASWRDTGVAIDSRDRSRADTLWDPAAGKLYVASHEYTKTGTGSSAAMGARLYRYSYDAAARRYLPDAGFPAQINSAESETLVIDKDSTGTLWATWTESGHVYVAHTVGRNDAAWGSPYIVPGPGTQVTSDDISSLVHFGGNHVGLMWSNQYDREFHFATHTDGAGDSAWSSTTVPLGFPADDHINLKADGTGRVYAAVKTSSVSPGAPLVVLLVRAPDGTWGSAPSGTVADSNTRAIALVDGSEGAIHVFATCPQPPRSSGQSGGDICQKTSPLAAPAFPPGPGLPVIRDAGSPHMNDATSTKQAVGPATGIAVLASNSATETYWHAQESIAGPAPPVVHHRRIHLRVRPHRTHRGRLTRFVFRTRVLRHHRRVPLAGVRISFARHRLRTNRHGRAVVRLRLHRVGRYRVIARKRGFKRARAVVRDM